MYINIFANILMYCRKKMKVLSKTWSESEWRSTASRSRSPTSTERWPGRGSSAASSRILRQERMIWEGEQAASNQPTDELSREVNSELI